jgi:cysteine desulfurase
MAAGGGIYLDHNATTPLLPAAAEAMRPFAAEVFGNPASPHRFGQKARQALEQARATVAACLDADPGEVVFTSGATESNNLALLGLAGGAAGRIVASKLEHPSVAGPLDELRRRGWEFEDVPLSPEGELDAEALAALAGRAERGETHDGKGYVSEYANEPCQPGAPTSLVTLQLANPEIGAIQPVARLMGRLGNTAVHCDATQAVGKIPVSFRKLGVTTLAASGHKFHGPKGIGLLLVRKGVVLKPLHHGGHQQQGLRPGTEPVALAVGLAVALQHAVDDLPRRTAHLERLRQLFLAQLQRQGCKFALNGPARGGLAHTVNLSFPGCEAAALLMKLDLAGIACSTGSACSSGSLLPAPVLAAMGLPPERQTSALRFSMGFQQEAAEIAEAARRIAAAVRELGAGKRGE